MPGLQWQKRPQRARTQDKGSRTNEHREKFRRMAHIAKTGAHGSEDVFGRHSALLRSRLPAIDHNHHAQERNRIEQKDDSRSSGGDQKASEGWADRARNVDGNAHQSNSRRELAPRY